MFIVTASMLSDPQFAAWIKTQKCLVVILCVPEDVPRFTAEFKTNRKFPTEIEFLSGEEATDEVILNTALSIEMLRDGKTPQGEIVICVPYAHAEMRDNILEFVRSTRKHCNVRAITSDPSSFEGLCPAVTPVEAVDGAAVAAGGGAAGGVAAGGVAASGGRRRRRRRGGGGH